MFAADDSDDSTLDVYKQPDSDDSSYRDSDDDESVGTETSAKVCHAFVVVAGAGCQPWCWHSLSLRAYWALILCLNVAFMHNYHIIIYANEF